MSTIEIQFEKNIDNSRVVREFDLRCRTDYICITLLGAVFVLGTLFYAWQQFQWIQYGYRIEEIRREIDDLSELGRRLSVERARLASPPQIELIARRELGMVRGGAEQYIVPEGAGRRDLETGPTLFALEGGGRAIGQ